MEKRKPLAQLQPMVVGRVTRVVFGVVTIALIWIVGLETLSIWGALALGFLGLSFLVGGLVGNPGCELTSLWNVATSKAKRVHCL